MIEEANKTDVVTDDVTDRTLQTTSQFQQKADAFTAANGKYFHIFLWIIFLR